MIGTGAILIKMKERNLISSVKPLLNILSDSGYRLSKPLIQEIFETG